MLMLLLTLVHATGTFRRNFAVCDKSGWRLLTPQQCMVSELPDAISFAALDELWLVPRGSEHEHLPMEEAFHTWSCSLRRAPSRVARQCQSGVSGSFDTHEGSGSEHRPG